MSALILEVDLCYQVRTQVNVEVGKGLDFSTMYQQAKEQACYQVMQNNSAFVSGSLEYLNCEFVGSKEEDAGLRQDEIARLHDGFDAETYAEQINIERAEASGIAEYEAKCG